MVLSYLTACGVPSVAQPVTDQDMLHEDKGDRLSHNIYLHCLTSLYFFLQMMMMLMGFLLVVTCNVAAEGDAYSAHGMRCKYENGNMAKRGDVARMSDSCRFVSLCAPSHLNPNIDQELGMT